MSIPSVIMITQIVQLLTCETDDANDEQDDAVQLCLENSSDSMPLSAL